MFDFPSPIKSLMMPPLNVYCMCLEEDEALFPNSLTWKSGIVLNSGSSSFQVKLQCDCEVWEVA